MEFLFVYITAGTVAEARTIGRALVEERLAASVNIIGGVESFYWWEGAVQQAAETVVIAKTRADLLDAVTARVKALHGYRVPCVVALRVAPGGNPDYLDWIIAETRPPSGPGAR